MRQPPSHLQRSPPPAPDRSGAFFILPVRSVNPVEQRNSPLPAITPSRPVAVRHGPRLPRWSRALA
ncbi:hypothetical protein K438DRAFT_198313 [Mycena galopus ATCC 62051]|nr:hypothetical protein K438DRAFT_198313 [Mycena galopus ATCC 62051]